MRIWRTSPFVAIVAVTALSMGIGFTTTMFSIAHGATARRAATVQILQALRSD
jgi:hypothetical protein